MNFQLLPQKKKKKKKKKKKEKDSGVSCLGRRENLTQNSVIPLPNHVFYLLLLQFPLIFTLDSVISLSDYLSIWHPHYWIFPLLIRPKLHTSKNDDKLSYPQYWAACKIWTWVDSIFFTFSFFSSPNQIKES